MIKLTVTASFEKAVKFCVPEHSYCIKFCGWIKRVKLGVIENKYKYFGEILSKQAKLIDGL